MHWRIWIRLSVLVVLAFTAYSMYTLLKPAPKPPNDGVVNVTIIPAAP